MSVTIRADDAGHDIGQPLRRFGHSDLRRAPRRHGDRGIRGEQRDQAGRLEGLVQEYGRGIELAEERWILEVANIYENAFNEAWDKGRSRANNRSRFYKLLEISRPESFPSHGKLNPRQVKRVFERTSRTGLERKSGGVTLPL